MYLCNYSIMTENDKYEIVIGLEVHAQLNTKTKIFAADETVYGAAPNTQISPITLGLPGVLPMLNKEVVEKAVKLGIALHCTITEENHFARKNYFYADLPKGYQISQDKAPVCTGGYVEIEVNNERKQISLTRIHMEEDAGKNNHELDEQYSLIDLNRAGTPLIEIVTEPDMRSAEEAVAFAKKLHSIVTTLGICDGEMSQGSMRFDVNISVRKPGALLGTRTETKNLNSFRFMEDAIAYEVERQIEVIEDGGKVVQETRLYDPDKKQTRSMRSKEDAQDYRYFPDPDLLPLMIAPEWKARVQAEMPELPGAMKGRFMDDWGLSAYDATTLTASKEVADFYQATVSAAGAALAKPCANWVMGELAARLNKAELDVAASPVSPAQLAGLVARIADNSISNAIGKKVFEALWNGEGATADEIIATQGLRQVTDSGAIEAMIDEVLAANQKSVEEFRAGKDKAFNALVGQVMKASKGKAGPAQVNALLRKKLGA